MHVQSCCFAHRANCFFDVIIVVVVFAKAPYCWKSKVHVVLYTLSMCYPFST